MKKALLTIGNLLRGDDGAGYALGAIIEGRPGWKVFQGGDCPENQVHLIRSYAPDIVIIVDAVLGIEEGDARFMDITDEETPMFTTHTIPVQYLIRFIKDFCNPVLFLGMGVSKNKISEIDQSLSVQATRAVAKADSLIKEFDEMLV